MNKSQKLVLAALFLGIILSSQIIKAEQNPINTLNQEVIIFEQGLEYKVRSAGRTIKEILVNANIETQKNDIVFPSLTYEVKENQYPIKIIIERATPIFLNVYGEVREVYTREDRVIEVIGKEDIDFKEDDLINYNFNEEIFPGIEIKIWKRPKPKPKIDPEPLKIVKTGESQTGIASWYSYIPGDFCASINYREGTKLLVTNLDNGKKVIVTVNDYGPFNGPIVDLEQSAFLKLASLWEGVIRVKIEKIEVH